MKIGVFDSGIGGITVLSELKKALPGVDFVYLGDTAHLPYGTKSPAQIKRLSCDCARTLKKRDVDAVVVACNTASSWALGAIQKVMGKVPVFGVLDPGVEAVVEASTPKSPILVLATRATVRSGAYGKKLRKRLKRNRIEEQACPLLVPMIEEGWVNHPVLHQTIREYVAKYRGRGPNGVAHLACTHYPWIHKAFEKALPGWKVINSAQAVARSLERSTLWKRHLKSGRSAGRSRIEWIFTDPDAVPSFAFKLTRKTGSL